VAPASSGGTWIYVMRWERCDRKMIKIGKSTQPRDQRRKQHEAADAAAETTLTTIAEMRGSPVDETTIHNYFAEERLEGRELFQPSLRLMAWIRWLRDQHWVADESTSNEKREAMPRVSAEAWLPGPGREKVIPPAAGGMLPFEVDPLELGPREMTLGDYYTSELIVERARSAMGSIDLDPASCAEANSVVRATRIYTASDRGECMPWAGNVWLNPPFGEWGLWGERVIAEMRKRPRTVPQMCVLAPQASISTKYLHPLLANCQAIVIFYGRIPFWGDLCTSTPMDGHFVMYYGDHVERFAEAFSALGTVYRTQAPYRGAYEAARKAKQAEAASA